MAHTANVCQWDVELAPEGPELVESFDFKMNVIVSQRYFDHASRAGS